MNSARCDSVAGVSAQASRVTNGRRRCRSASDARSFSYIASLQIGREKQSGMPSTRRTGWHAKPAATMAARAELELPIQDVIEAVHGGRPLGTPTKPDCEPWSAISRIALLLNGNDKLGARQYLEECQAAAKRLNAIVHPAEVFGPFRPLYRVPLLRTPDRDRGRSSRRVRPRRPQTMTSARSPSGIEMRSPALSTRRPNPRWPPRSRIPKGRRTAQPYRST